jgi:hypothetical protein
MVMLTCSLANEIKETLGPAHIEEINEGETME